MGYRTGPRPEFVDVGAPNQAPLNNYDVRACFNATTADRDLQLLKGGWLGGWGGGGRGCCMHGGSMRVGLARPWAYMYPCNPLTDCLSAYVSVCCACCHPQATSATWAVVWWPPCSSR
jgi:hypothetical protein